MNSKDFFKTIENKLNEATENIFFRVCPNSEDTLNIVSAELTDGRGQSAEEIADLYGYEEIEELKNDLEEYNPARPDMFESNMYWDDEGHLGGGLYYAGVCCETSMAALASYSNERGWHHYESAVIRVFEGKQNGDCNDGQVAIPTNILFDLPANFIERADIVEFIDYLLAGGTVN